MAEEIMVVRVESDGNGFKVFFSEPVWLCDTSIKYYWYCESDATDELGAYQWGLEVIEKHKERESRPMRPPKDRNDYRTMSAAELYDEAMRGQNVNYQELAIALAEKYKGTYR